MNEKLGIGERVKTKQTKIWNGLLHIWVGMEKGKDIVSVEWKSLQKMRENECV